MKSHLVVGLIFVCLLAPLSSPRANDLLYPMGANIIVDYRLSKPAYSSSDTITIVRTIVNLEDYELRGLYFSDLLPPNFTLISSVARLNSTDLATQVSMESEGSVIFGMSGYRWVIDAPSSSGTGDVSIRSGDTVVLVTKFRCDQAGDYLFPLHTTVFFSEIQGGFFATSDPQRVRIDEATSIGGDDDTRPGSYILASAYPNPFNASVSVAFERSSAGGDVLLEIFNSLGQRVYETQAAVDGSKGTFDWAPSEAAGTGLYIYRISSADGNARGKMLFLK